MRGKPLGAGNFEVIDRNIPAYAGKTCLPLPTGRFDPEHPRVCGENTPTNPGAGKSLGTSPRMRGKHPDFNCGAHKNGNIPAYAGKTLTNASNNSATGEHPRVCGEN